MMQPSPPSVLYAAVPLADGGALLAMGPAGVLRLGIGGDEVQRFDCTAHDLAVSEDGRVIAVDNPFSASVRGIGGPRRLHRIDLGRGTCRPWGELPIDVWAPTFEGARWYVLPPAVLADAPVHAVDLEGETPVIVATSVLPAFSPTAADREGDRLIVQGTTIGADHYDIFVLPSLEREVSADLPYPFAERWNGREFILGQQIPPVSLRDVSLLTARAGGARLSGHRAVWTIPLPGLGKAFGALGAYAAALVEVEGLPELHCVDLARLERVGRHRFLFPRPLGERRTSPGVRCWGSRVAAFAPEGEVMCIDLATMAVTLHALVRPGATRQLKN